MPLFKLKKVWNYCTYSKPFFILVLILYGIVNFTEHYYEIHSNLLIAPLVMLVSYVVVAGYGLTITRDRANHGVRLPKIHPKSVLVLGIKSIVVSSIYMLIQLFLLSLISFPLGFPVFDLRELLLNLDNTLNLLFTRNPESSIIFLIFGSILFYITMFFLEIALARLADTKEIMPSLNIISIKRTIDVIGWRHYTKDCTLIILAIVILGFFKSYPAPMSLFDFIIDIILDLFIFATEFLGIGAIYSKYKDNQRTSIDIE